MLREIAIRENGHEPPLCNPYNMQWVGLLCYEGNFF